MGHWRSGLPKLPIEPFDATPLYAAARAASDSPAERPRRRPRAVRRVVGILLLLVAAGAGVAAWLLL